MKHSVNIIRKESYFRAGFPLVIMKIAHKHGEFPENKRFQREFWKITFILNGHGKLLIDDNAYPIQKGSIFLIHPGTETSYVVDDQRMEIYNILFDADLIAPYLSEVKDNFQFFAIFSSQFIQLDKAPYYILKSNGPFYESLIRNLENEQSQQKSNYQAMMKHRLMELLILMLRLGEHKFHTGNPDMVLAYLDYRLAHHYRDDFDLDEIAANIGISKEHLCRIYKTARQTTLIATLKKNRLSFAADELRSTQKSIGEICYEAGFNDLSYFYRAFNDAFGTNPGNYRKNLDNIDI